MYKVQPLLNMPIKVGADMSKGQETRKRTIYK